MLKRLGHMLRKELRQMLRDPRMRIVIFIAPLVQLFVMGFAITTDVRNISLGVLDHDNSPASRELISRFSASGYFKITEYAATESEMSTLLEAGQVRCLLRLNAGYGAALAAGRSAQIQLLVDGTDSNTSGIVINYANNIVTGYMQELLIDRQANLGIATPGRVVIEPRAYYNETLNSSHYFVPGLFAMILTVITVLLTALAVVRETEIGTIEQIMVTPLRPLEFILGKTLPFALVGMITVTLMLFLAMLVFGMPFHGSVLLFYAGALLFFFSALSIGLLISTVSQTQQQALLGAFLFMMPAALLSGFMFPIRNMPVVVQWLTYLNPMRYVLNVIRGVLLKGSGFDVLWPEFLGMAVLGVVFMSLAALRFRKTAL